MNLQVQKNWRWQIRETGNPIPDELYDMSRSTMRAKGIRWLRDIAGKLGLRHRDIYSTENLIEFIEYMKYKDFFSENT